jgi:hypothetical protein
MAHEYQNYAENGAFSIDDVTTYVTNSPSFRQQTVYTCTSMLQATYLGCGKELHLFVPQSLKNVFNPVCYFQVNK